MLSDQQVERYSRQILLHEIGGRGQERLLSRVVLIDGIGALAETFALYLARAGIGTLALSDGLNPPGENENCVYQFTAAAEQRGARDQRPPWHLAAALNAAPHHVTRLNRLCVRWEVPLLYAKSNETYGCCGLFEGHHATRRCAQCEPIRAPKRQLHRSLLASEILGSWLASEAIKLCLDLESSLRGNVVEFDGLRATFREKPTAKNPACTVCSNLSPQLQAGLTDQRKSRSSPG